MWQNTTPVPNAVFDIHLKDLSIAELKVLLVIIRQTLGWKDKQTKSARKETDWISGSQLESKTGASPRSINTAIHILVKKKLIEIFDYDGRVLDTPEKRRGKPRLYFRLSCEKFADVHNKGIASSKPKNSGSTYANIAEDLRKKRQALAQTLRITK